MASVAHGHPQAYRPVSYRKPLPQSTGMNLDLQPLTKINPAQSQLQSQPQSQPQPQPPLQQQAAAQQPSHGHSRTTSSSGAMPPSAYPQTINPSTYQAYSQNATRRTLSNATASTSSTANGAPHRQNSGSSLGRSTSSRSGGGPPSYVVLMRKQKATVWSDRAQHEDPGRVAQQRAAKMRAAMEVSGTGPNRISTSGSSSITSGVRSKMRHHGAPKAQYVQPNLVTGVPMRLSANEVEDEDSEEENLASKGAHQRSGSGRSSVGSGRLQSMQGLRTSAGHSASNTPPSRSQGQSPMTEIPRPDRASAFMDKDDPGQTPVPEISQRSDYFEQKTRTSGTESGGSSERENSFGQARGLPQRLKVAEDKMDPADLQRRGSVDERTMTMSGYGKLFVANPDVS